MQRSIGAAGLGRAAMVAAMGFALLGTAGEPAWALSDKEEAALGKEMASVEAWMGGVLPASDPSSRRVERIGKRFAHLARARDFGYRYRVLASGSVLNAFAAPGGTIYITRRLVSFARSDDELASILGHETAHVSLRHIAREMEDRDAFLLFGARLGQEMRRRAAEDAARTTRTPASTSTQHLARTSVAGAKSNPATARPAHKNSPPHARTEEGRSLTGGSLWGNISWFVLSRGRSRAMESQADAQSVRWMRRLGYNPRAAIAILQHAQSSMPSSGSPLASFLASHPGTPQRVQALREIIEREQLDLPSKTKTASPTPAADPTPQAS